MLRRYSDRRAVIVLLATLPSYVPVYEELSSRDGESLSAATLVAEVAKEAEDLLSRSRDRRDEARLELIAEALELVSEEPRLDGAQLIDAFLSTLSPSTRRRFDAYLRPATERRVLAADERIDDDGEQAVRRAAPRPLRPRPRRYSGRGPRRRRRL